MNLRFGLAIHSSARGGFKAMLQEAEELVALGHVVHVLSPKPDAPLPSGVLFDEVPPSASALRLGAVLAGWQRRHRFDLVHLHGRGAGIVGRVALPRGSKI